MLPVVLARGQMPSGLPARFRKAEGSCGGQRAAVDPDRNRGRRAARFLVANPQKEAPRCTYSLRSVLGIQLMMGLPRFLLYHSDDGSILRVFSVGRPCCTIVDSRSGTRTRRKANGLVHLPLNAEAGPFVKGHALDMSSETA